MTQASKDNRNSQRGMTLIEAAVAILILTIGVMAVTALFATGMKYMGNSQYTLIAKTKAGEAVESVFSARDDQSLNWASIRNVQGSSGTDGGVFVDGPCPINAPDSTDGLVNTALSVPTGTPEFIVLPGPDGVYGNGDDIQVPLTRLSREIVIRDVTGVSYPLRSIQVIIRDASTANAGAACGSNSQSGFKGVILYQIQTYISPYT
ncbi:MAG TPA: prepilin-type N-terminal cleavage/methylation domain-containing protein [Candidatus Binatia bacterium]|nr:prepilin-type N-terminal cleavage/methylation domain-containing protein [Candidatus Binatia bacterium]